MPAEGQIDPRRPGADERRVFASKGLDNIQALRAIAALLVVLVHLAAPVAALGIAPFGAGGVDLFFVISGFIMVYTTAGRTMSGTEFLGRRIVRIVPLYWTLTLAVFGIALTAPTLLQFTTASWGQLLKSLFFIPFAKANGDVQPVLFLGWTLNYEMFFYLLFAVGISYSNRAAGIGAVMTALAAIVTAGVVWHPQGVVADFYSQPIILEFAGGMLIGLAARRRLLRWPKPGMARAALCLLGLIMAVGIAYQPPHLTRAVSIGIPAFIVVAGAVSLNLSGAVIGNPLLLRLGDASYSIYLTHPFVTQLVLRFARRFEMNTLTAALTIVIAFGVVCVTGLLTHYYVELPLIWGCKKLGAGVVAVARANRRVPSSEEPGKDSLD